ncbi:uncharacterized protein SAPINGB_P004561 [Magnusiomyces paraingens]|uniref:Glyoxylate reductase n=1 Tax=Magnusiomyces paraingens TaxID=2606893 RepID=A0A5E8C0N0_9ASCO|nr:uncharacterized protein SAPINGB_P004561 [Saprochaete ingens]VVT55367.1 unnamed protein product [Saprochaete ingens]
MSTSTSPKPKILLLGEIIHAQKEWQGLSDIAELVTAESKNREEFIHDLSTKYSDVTAIYRTLFSVGITGRFDEDLVRHFPKSLKFVGHFGAGYDQIDVHALSAQGIQISNTPNAVVPGTADTNIFLVIGALRNFSYGQYQLRQNKWLSSVELGHDPQGKVLGILGMGGIGQAVRDRAVPLGFDKIIYYNRRRLPADLEKDSEYKPTIDELLAEADVISINVPLNKETKHLINKETISKMKDGVVIVNTARGPVINEQDLVDGLESGKIGAVGLDVFEHEPVINPGLLNNPRTLLLPHMGTHSYESRFDMENLVIENLRSGLTTGKLITLVPEQQGAF